MRCLNFSDNSLLSCFSNDYGFDKWILKTIEIFADKKRYNYFYFFEWKVKKYD